MSRSTNTVAEELETLARLDASKVQVSVTSRQICCLYAIDAWLRRNLLASLTEPELRDVIRTVLAVIEQDAELPEKRITHTQEDLCKGQLLIRTDSGGITAAGRWTVSPLAQHIVRFFVDELALDAQSLVVTTTTIRGLLHRIEADAQVGGDAAWWETKVTLLLDTVVSELVQGIDRRRRGLDVRQEQVRRDIRAQLDLGWEDALGKIEQLLSTTADTIDELHVVVLRELDGLDTALGKIDDLAEQAAVSEALAAVQRVREYLYQLREWSSDRHAAWSTWYQRVQRNARELIRLDPGRRISTRLREHIRNWEAAPWALQILVSQKLRPLRPVESVRHREPVTGARPARVPLQECPVEDDGEAKTIRRLRKLLAEYGELTLRNALAEILPDPSLGDTFGAIGVVAHHLVGVGRVPERSPPTRAWEAIDDKGIEIQDFLVLQPRAESASEKT